MGKSKQRIMGRGKNLSYMYDMTRHQAIDFVVNELMTKPKSIKAKKMISLFGLHAEELTEAGACYESVSNIENIYSLH
ncbi:MAG: hypothetical protein K6A44_06135 [bacterium]|nr:hypothetical protein [bacterium]